MYIPTPVPAEPKCLVCGQTVSLEPDKRIVAQEHRVDGNQVACRGTGFVYVQDDGRDDVRRQAIRQFRSLMIDIEERRGRMLSDLSKSNWSMAVAVDYHADRIVPLEEEARLWRALALHGDWWENLRSVLSGVMTRSTGDALAMHGMADLVVRGQRNWISNARSELLDLDATMGSAGEVLAGLVLQL